MTTDLHTRSRLLPLGALLAADGASRMGNAVTIVAVPLLALHIVGSPWAVAAAGVAAALPLIIGGLVGGVLVDRLGFRRASVIADAASGATLLAMPVLASIDALSLEVLLGLVFLSNLLDALGSAARSSQLPELCELAGVSLSKAAAWKATIARTATMLGASVAGIMVATVGAGNAMYVPVGMFAVAIVLTLTFVPRVNLVEVHGDDAKSVGSGWAELTAGIRFVARTPLVRAVVIMVVLTNAIDIAGSTVFFPLYAAGLGDGGAGFGLMVACFAGGALVGAALYGIVGDRVPRRVLFVVLFVVAGLLPYATLAFAPPFPVVLSALAVSGLAAGPLNPLIDSALLRLIPPAIRARVLGALAAGVMAAMPLGSLLAGVAVAGMGLTAALALTACLYLIVILVTAFGRRWQNF